MLGAQDRRRARRKGNKVIQFIYFDKVTNLISQFSTTIAAFFLFLVGFMPLSLNAQSRVNQICDEIGLSYFGRTLTHPGFKIGISSIAIGNDTSGIFFARLPISAGMYYHRNNQFAYFAIVEIAPALSFCKSWFVSLPLGIGYMRTFLDGKVYSVNNEGIVRREYLVGSNYLMPSAGLNFGYHRRKSRISKVFLTLGCFGQYPYNTYMLPNIYGEIGIAWRRK